MNFLKRLQKHPGGSGDNPGASSGAVTVVSGLPRSGTSMMMQILQAGGMEILTDHIRSADDDNPRGYYEFERVKKLKDGDTSWVYDARGKGVKIISYLLEYLPGEVDYQVVFMQRDMDEILASQKQMLLRRGEPPDVVEDGTIAAVFQGHLAEVTSWLAGQPNMKVHYVAYSELLDDPEAHIEALVDFLNRGDSSLDVEAMLGVPSRSLYRQRSEGKSGAAAS
jgi:hypothetical protein